MGGIRILTHMACMACLLVSSTNTPISLTTVELWLAIRVRVRARVVTLGVQSLKNTTIWESVKHRFSWHARNCSFSFV